MVKVCSPKNGLERTDKVDAELLRMPVFAHAGGFHHPAQAEGAAGSAAAQHKAR